MTTEDFLDDQIEETQAMAFAGHDSNVDADLRWSAPEMAGAHTLAAASAGGSPQARRRARILIAVFFGLPILLGLGLAILDSLVN